MIRQPQACKGLVVVGATRRGSMLISRLQPSRALLAESRRACQDERETDDNLSNLEDEYSKLKVNWFPGHMAKATRIIREKLKQVDMVFEVRDARIPFSSANEDLDSLVGSRKARLIVLNKADLANQALEQRVLQRFKEQGKDAVYACGRTGGNVSKILAWARHQGPKRGEFHTTGAIAMVVGMPNVGKSSLINLLLARGKALRRHSSGKGAMEAGQQQVARVGAMPGVTRQVSAFRISSNPPLYLVDTPGVMVPRVDSATKGLRLALTRAVPDAALPPDTLVAFMLRMVRMRRILGTRGSGNAAVASPGVVCTTARAPSSRSKGGGRSESNNESVTRERPEQKRHHTRGVSHAVEAWLLKSECVSRHPRVCRGVDEDYTESSFSSEENAVRDPWVYGDRWNDDDDDGMEALLRAVERESGAEGKPDAEARYICCRYLLEAFREGQFGRITLDGIPRWGTRKQREAAELCGDNSSRGHEEDHVSPSPKSERQRSNDRVQLSDEALSRVDWSSATAWERTEVRRG